MVLFPASLWVFSFQAPFSHRGRKSCAICKPSKIELLSLLHLLIERWQTSTFNFKDPPLPFHDKSDDFLYNTKLHSTRGSWEANGVDAFYHESFSCYTWRQKLWTFKGLLTRTNRKTLLPYLNQNFLKVSCQNIYRHAMVQRQQIFLVASFWRSNDLWDTKYFLSPAFNRKIFKMQNFDWLPVYRQG